MQNKKINRNKILGFSILGILLLSMIVVSLRTRYLNNLPQNYTVGEIVGTFKLRKQGRKVEYNYTVNGETFRGSTPESNFESPPEVGDKFMVSFPEKYGGKYGFIMTSYKVEKDLTSPAGGWDNLK